MKLPDKPDVLIMGHPLLFEKQPPVHRDIISDKVFQDNLKKLKSAQETFQGIGIAAPQIGWQTRIFCIGIFDEHRTRYPQAPDIPFSFWINPEIIKSSDNTCWAWEGCLSVPGIRAWVERPASIRVTGLDEKGLERNETLSGFQARVFQHEIDHLDGILFPMRVDDTKLIIPDEAMSVQDHWPHNWPTVSARKTLRGELSETR